MLRALKDEMIMAQRMRDVKQGRPYPKDWQRKQAVMVKLMERHLSISDLANQLGVKQGNLSCVIWGVRKSPVMETRIAEFFGLTRDQLFPRKAVSLGGIAA